MLTAISYPPIPMWEIGPLSLSLHGVFAGLGFVAGALLMLAEVRRRGFDAEKTTSVLTWALVASLLGARFLTVPAHLGDAGYGWGDVFNVAGDYSIIGGYVGGIIGGVIRMRMLKLPAVPLLDMAAPGLALGAVVGRIGDLAIVEHLGSPTSFFLGYTVRGGYDIAPQHDALECAADICGTYHHTALYDMIGAAVLLVVLLLLRTRWDSRRYGQLFAVWAMWYGVQRFLIDFTRLGAAEDGTVADSVMGPFTGSQWGALAVAAMGLWLFVRWRHNPTVSSMQDAVYGADNGLGDVALVPAAGTDDPDTADDATTPDPPATE